MVDNENILLTKVISQKKQKNTPDHIQGFSNRDKTKEMFYNWRGESQKEIQFKA